MFNKFYLYSLSRAKMYSWRLFKAFEIILLILHTVCTRAQEHALSPPYTCTTTTTLCQPGANGHTYSNDDIQVTQGRPGKRGAAGEKGERGQKGDPCQCDVADEEAMRSLRRTMETLQSTNRDMQKKVENLDARVNLLFLPSNCIEYMYVNERNGISDGLAEIYPWKNIGNMSSVLINCSLYKIDDNGWIVIQKRYDGSVDFYRNWEAYVQGFGNKDGEFWLGLKTIHQITSLRSYKLRIDLTFKNGAVKYAQYSSFVVGSELDKFKLTVSGYSGTAGDKMTYHNDRAFTTFDADNDMYSSANCAVRGNGAWWYNTCYDSNLNGRYNTDFSWPYDSILLSSEMKIRPI
ncbi:fibrinogen-like protein A [Styela clava]